jgi:AraC family transcriptional regulator of arabinose operon
MDHRVTTVVALIHERPAITIAELATSVNLSTSRLRHLFRVEVGVSISTCLRRQRLLCAERLLTTTFLSIKQLSAASGFRDTCHFVREFHKAVGAPPTAYRHTAVFDKK